MSLVEGAAAQVVFLGGLRFLDKVQYVLGLTGCEISGRKLISDILVPWTDQIRRAKVKRCVSRLNMLQEELANRHIPLKIRTQLAFLLPRRLARLLELPRFEFGADNVKRNVRTVRRHGMCMAQMRKRSSRLSHVQQNNAEVIGSVGLFGVQGDRPLKLSARVANFILL